MRHLLTLASIWGAALLLSSRALAQPTVRVAHDAPAGGDGQSWATAYNALPTALAAAPAGAEIWVKAGLYTAPAGGFIMPSGRQLYGGFAGTETSRAQRNLASNTTTLHGNNQTTVVVINNGTVGTRVDGFLITGGLGRGSLEAQATPGGGIRVGGGTASIANCVLESNRTHLVLFPVSWPRYRGPGAGAFVSNATASFDSCRFVDNRTVNALGFGCMGGFPVTEGPAPGGAVYSLGSTVAIRSCVFERNRSGNGWGWCCSQDCSVYQGAMGGAICCQGGALAIERSVFRDNASGDGSHSFAILREGPSSPGGLGGAIAAADCALTIRDSFFVANRTGFGGDGSQPSWLSGAPAGRGAAIAVSGPPAILTNCTFVSNTLGADGRYSAPASGAGVSGPCIIRNCIFWNNRDASGFTQSAQIGDASDVAHSIIQGLTPGFGVANSSRDPHFADLDPSRLDLSPFLNSPAIDAGDNTAYLASFGATDLAGNPRFFDVNFVADRGAGVAPIIDIGAYEAQFQGTTCPVDLDNDGNLANGLHPDGAVTIDDLLAFLAGFEVGDIRVDLDDNGAYPMSPDDAVTVDDLIYFLAGIEC